MIDLRYFQLLRYASRGTDGRDPGQIAMKIRDLVL